MAKFEPVELMKDLVAITGEKWVSEVRFTRWADRLEVTNVQKRIAFLTKLKALMVLMPPNVFPDADARYAVLQAAQEAMDKAIELEDEEEP